MVYKCKYIDNKIKLDSKLDNKVKTTIKTYFNNTKRRIKQ